jgi:ribosomal protein S1
LNDPVPVEEHSTLWRVAMGVAVGDVVELTVVEVDGYACWGEAGGQTGFVHCSEWSRERPIPADAVPKVGDSLRVKVFRVIDDPREQLPLDMTDCGKFRVDFAASVILLQPDPADEPA